MAYSLAAQSQNNFNEKAEDGYDWGPLAKDTPLSLIREKTLAILGSVLNDDLCFKTESVVGSEALHRDWRGFLAYVNKSVKNRASEGNILTQEHIKNDDNKSREIIRWWINNEEDLTMEKLWGALEAIERFDVIQSVAAEIKHDCDLYQDQSKFILVLYGSHDQKFAEDWLIPRMAEIFKDQNCNILKPDLYDEKNPRRYNFQDDQIRRDIADQKCWKVIAVFSHNFPSSNLPQPNGHHESDWVAQAAKIDKKPFLLPIVYSDIQNSSKQIKCCQNCTDEQCGGKSIFGDLGPDCPRRLHPVVYNEATECLFNFWTKLTEPFDGIHLSDEQKVMDYWSDTGNEQSPHDLGSSQVSQLPNGHFQTMSHDDGNQGRGCWSSISTFFREMTNNHTRGTADAERGESSELAPFIHNTNNEQRFQFQTTNGGMTRAHGTIDTNIGSPIDEPSALNSMLVLREVSENTPLTANDTIETDLSFNTTELSEVHILPLQFPQVSQNIPSNLANLS